MRMSFHPAFSIFLLCFLSVGIVNCQNVYPYKQIRNAKATFYGDPDGFGSSGGACGFGDLISAGYGKYIAAGNLPFYKDGLGCGACYKVWCVQSKYCNGKSVIVPITDWCPGGGHCCPTCRHFDLSQPAFRMIANISAGVIPLRYRRVPCLRTGNIKFIVTGNLYWMNVMFQNVAGEGEISRAEVSGDGGRTFLNMEHSWGASWVYNKILPNRTLSFRLTSGVTKQKVKSKGCLFPNWTPGTYDCGIQLKQPPVPRRSPPPKAKRSPPPKAKRSPPPKAKRSPPPKAKRSPPPKAKRPSPPRKNSRQSSKQKLPSKKRFPQQPKNRKSPPRPNRKSHLASRKTA